MIEFFAFFHEQPVAAVPEGDQIGIREPLQRLLAGGKRDNLVVRSVKNGYGYFYFRQFGA